MTDIIKCPNCNDALIKSYSNDEVKLRATLIKWNKDGCFAVCKSCKQDVEVDLDILKEIETNFTYETKKDFTSIKE